MPRTKTTLPSQSKQEGQRSIQMPDYLVRNLPQWRHPEWVDANVWRKVVRHQPVATACKETLISQVSSLNWKIDVRDSTKRDENKELISYYSDFFDFTGKYDYTELLEMQIADLLDTPFGCGMELGWENDVSSRENPNSKLVWIEPLDSATLFPTLNDDWPVGQHVPEALGKFVYFPKHVFNRAYISPRMEITRWGWGCAPPEKIYLALELINRGDLYYANLLLDSPEVGILDLGDMEEGSAKNWVESWRELLTGIDPFKIPVLYGHEKPANFISFTRNPNELVFNQTITRYSALVASGYGMSLDDIGLSSSSNGGETLAGTIRQERRTRRTGLSRVKSKIISSRNKILPLALKFSFIDLDDEVAVALGRARLSSATAIKELVSIKVISPEEGRLQMIADGVFTIPMSEKIPESELSNFINDEVDSTERPGLLGRPIAPSEGGHGEVIPRSELLDILLEEVPEFRDVFETIESDWESYDSVTKDAIVSQLDEMLKIDE